MKSLLGIVLLVISSSLYGRWDFTDSMQVRRGGHTLTVLQNGKVLCVGGYYGVSTYKTCEIFDPTTEKWEFTDSLHIARAFPTATLLNDGRVLIVGGRNDATYFNSCEIYNPDSAKWTLFTNCFSNGLYEHTATLMNDGKVLIAGGGNNLYDCTIFDPVANEFQSAQFLHKGRNGHAATLLPDGKVLVVGGGISMTQTTKTCEMYDTLTKQWTYASSMHFKRYLPTATLLQDSNVFVTGGWDTAVKSELYDFKTQQWTVIADTLGDTLGSYKRGYSKVDLLLNGKLLIAGGSLKSTSKSTRNCELYDPGTNHFTLTDSLHWGRVCGASVLLPDGRVLVAGGYDYPWEYVRSCEIYTYEQGVEEATQNSPPEADKTQKLIVSPNPFVRTAGVRGLGLGIGKIRIYDISGKMVEETDKAVIGKNLKTGVYFVKVNNSKLTKIIKLGIVK